MGGQDRPDWRALGELAGLDVGQLRASCTRKRYDRLMEDLHDLAVVAERRNEPSISLDEMTKRLRKRGIL